MIYKYFGDIPVKAQKEFLDYFYDEDVKEEDLKKSQNYLLLDVLLESLYKRHCTKVIKDKSCTFLYKLNTESYSFKTTKTFIFGEYPNQRDIIFGDTEVEERVLSSLEKIKEAKERFLFYNYPSDRYVMPKFLKELLENYDSMIIKLEKYDDI